MWVFGYVFVNNTGAYTVKPGIKLENSMPSTNGHLYQVTRGWQHTPHGHPEALERVTIFWSGPASQKAIIVKHS